MKAYNYDLIPLKVQAWLDGVLKVSKTVREGLSEIPKRGFISIHINELLENVAIQEYVDYSIYCLEYLLKSARLRELIGILRINLKPSVEFGELVSVDGTAMATLLADEPPEIFLYDSRGKTALNQWLKSGTILRSQRLCTADDLRIVGLSRSENSDESSSPTSDKEKFLLVFSGSQLEAQALGAGPAQ